MDISSRSRERVASRIERLEETYESFPVNQTTLAVPARGYERALERSKKGLADVYIEVYNDDGEVLLVHSEGSREIPRGQTKSNESLEAGARREVRESAGVECTIEDIHQATIFGVVDEDDADRDPVYRLVVVFVGRFEGAVTKGASVEWHHEMPEHVRP
ncbi:MAG: NUDIX hydrolase [Haloarculaceae archaeon]